MDRDTRIARAAGILEGEGSFYISNGTLKVTCEMTDEDVIQELRDLFGGTVVPIKIRKNAWKQSWRWQASGETAYRVILLVREFLFERRGNKIDRILEEWLPRYEARMKQREAVNLAAREYLKGGKSYRILEEEFGVSRTAILNKVHKM